MYLCRSIAAAGIIYFFLFVKIIVYMRYVCMDKTHAAHGKGCLKNDKKQ